MPGNLMCIAGQGAHLTQAYRSGLWPASCARLPVLPTVTRMATILAQLCTDCSSSPGSACQRVSSSLWLMVRLAVAGLWPTP